ncbi:MAG: YHS domain-containing protein [Sedimentisphaerales bacterium]|jgi:YHS domain-containing protein|nr:YHS domain-containing protein [Sedimentisphaerales bacterium]
MNDSMKSAARTLMIAAIALAAVVLFSGCKKHNDDHAGHDHASVEESAAETVAIAQTTCPVMEGNSINKNLFVEYEGEKVYFCCAGCPEMFLADPEKYIAKLPQFNE